LSSVSSAGEPSSKKYLILASTSPSAGINSLSGFKKTVSIFGVPS